MAPDRWQATYTRIDAMEYRPKTAGPPPPPAVLQGVPGSGGRSPVRKGIPKPESKQPCLQRHRCLACSKASDSGALVGAPSQTRLLELDVGPAAVEKSDISGALGPGP